MVFPEEHQSELQRSMQERVLESSRFPEISFTSDSVKAVSKDSWLVSGRLMLHGEVKPISVSVHRADGTYIGTVTIAGGTVKVKNELKTNFTISTK